MDLLSVHNGGMHMSGRKTEKKYQNVEIGYSQGNTELYQHSLSFLKDLLESVKKSIIPQVQY